MNIATNSRSYGVERPIHRLQKLSALVLTACLLVSTYAPTPAIADPDKPRPFSERDLQGTWVYSGLLKFAAPIPIPALHIHGGPPHAMVAPGDKVGIWGSLLGQMKFDGAGAVTAEDVFQAGDLQPLPPVPLPSLPPSPERHAGTYSVADNGIVEIQLEGFALATSEPGDVDFEWDLHCILNRFPQQMECVNRRFKTFVVDPSGYEAPVTGVLTFRRQY